MNVLVLNGPNLNLLGTREPAVYGATTLADVDALCREAGQARGAEVQCRQSNHEGQLIDWIHEAGVAHREGRPARRYFETTAAGRRALLDGLGRYPVLQAIPKPEPR